MNQWYLDGAGSSNYFWAYYTGLTGEDDYAGIFVPSTYSGTFHPITPAVGPGSCVYSRDAYVYAVSYEEVEGWVYLVIAKISMTDGQIVSQSRFWKYTKTAERGYPTIRSMSTSDDYIFVDLKVVGYYLSNTTAPFMAILDKSTLAPISVRYYAFTPSYGTAQQLTLINYNGLNLYCAKIPTTSSVTKYWIGSFSVDGSGVITLLDGQRYNYSGYDLRFDATVPSTMPLSEKYWIDNGVMGFFASPAKNGYIEFYGSTSQVLGLHYGSFGSGYYATRLRISSNEYVGSSSGFTDSSIGKSSFNSSYPAVWFPDSEDYDLDCSPTTEEFQHLTTTEDKFNFYVYPTTFSIGEVGIGDMTVTEFGDMPSLSYVTDVLQGDLGSTTLFQEYTDLSIPLVTNIEIPDLAIQTCGYEYQGSDVYTLDYNLYCMHSAETVSVYFEYGRGALNYTTASDTGISATSTGDLNTENTPSGYTYYYRAVAVDSSGRKAYGAIRTITGSIVTLPTATISRVGSIKHVYDRTQAGIPPKFYMEVNLGGLAPEYMDAFTDQPITYVINRPPAGGAINGGRPDPVYPPDDSYNDYPPDYDPPWPDTSRPRNGGR